MITLMTCYSRQSNTLNNIMTQEQINRLLADGCFAEPKLIETHISWVILSGEFAYKIKKPINYSFLDFSTLEKRKYYCEKEIELNKRLTGNIYIDVQCIKENSGRYTIDERPGGEI